MTRRAFIANTGLLLLVGCVTTPTFVSHGIPNLRIVDSDKNIFRGGQPDAEGFAYLKSVGITNIVKLNLEDNEDADAKKLGLNIVYVPIDTDDQIFYLPKWKFEKAVNAIVSNTYVHCEHGQDRTGLIVAGYQMKNGMSKTDAEKIMLADGFHKSLFGLWEFFKSLK